jgi:hypothetical protein
MHGTGHQGAGVQGAGNVRMWQKCTCATEMHVVGKHSCVGNARTWLECRGLGPGLHVRL